jgi:hypothetical protein
MLKLAAPPALPPEALAPEPVAMLTPELPVAFDWFPIAMFELLLPPA